MLKHSKLQFGKHKKGDRSDPHGQLSPRFKNVNNSWKKMNEKLDQR